MMVTVTQNDTQANSYDHAQVTLLARCDFSIGAFDN